MHLGRARLQQGVCPPQLEKLDGKSLDPREELASSCIPTFVIKWALRHLPLGILLGQITCLS